MSVAGYFARRNERPYVSEKERENSLEERLRFAADSVRPMPVAEGCDAVLRWHCRVGSERGLLK